MISAPSELSRWWRSTGAVLLVLSGLACVASKCACTPPQTAEQAAAEGAYGAALVDCVERASTLAESKACRARVDAAWGVDGGSK